MKKFSHNFLIGSSILVFVMIVLLAIALWNLVYLIKSFRTKNLEKKRTLEQADNMVINNIVFSLSQTKKELNEIENEKLFKLFNEHIENIIKLDPGSVKRQIEQQTIFKNKLLTELKNISDPKNYIKNSDLYKFLNPTNLSGNPASENPANETINPDDAILTKVIKFILKDLLTTRYDRNNIDAYVVRIQDIQPNLLNQSIIFNGQCYKLTNFVYQLDQADLQNLIIEQDLIIEQEIIIKKVEINADLIVLLENSSIKETREPVSSGQIIKLDLEISITIAKDTIIKRRVGYSYLYRKTIDNLDYYDWFTNESIQNGNFDISYNSKSTKKSNLKQLVLDTTEIPKPVKKKLILDKDQAQCHGLTIN